VEHERIFKIRLLSKFARRAIYFSCVNFFLFLMIARRTIISGSTGPIFAVFLLKAFWVQMIDLDFFFPISQGMLPWQPILWKNGIRPSFVALAFGNGMGYRYLNVCK